MQNQAQQTKPFNNSEPKTFAFINVKILFQLCWLLSSSKLTYESNKLTLSKRVAS